MPNKSANGGGRANETAPMNRGAAAGGGLRDLDDPVQVRKAIRAGTFRGFTNAVASGFVQGNLVVVPEAQADAFAEYCRLNSQPLPIIGRSRVGDPTIPQLGMDMDLRTDVGGYMVFRDGKLVATPTEIRDIWRDDFVAFVLGCSFSFEAMLPGFGVRLRHREEGNVSAMYVTNIDTVSAGPFGGKLVVSMRALRPNDAITATLVSARYPQFHGAPIWIGIPKMIGIDDLANSYGGHGLTSLNADEIPVFWACGATAQIAALQARLPICITHYKAHMVVTDVPLPNGAGP